MSHVHTAYRLRALVRLACACALIAGCGDARVTPSVDSVTPSFACNGTVTTLSLAGSGFEVRVANVLFGPHVESPTVTATASGGPTAVLLPRWQSADALDADLPAKVPAGNYDVTVTNPDGASATVAHALTIDASPTVGNVTPAQICAGGGTVDVGGTGFVAGATVTVTDGMVTLAATGVTVTGPSSLSVQLGSNSFANNAPLALTVINPDGCRDTLVDALRLKPGGGGCP